MGEALLTACRLCDERGCTTGSQRLPDPDKTIASYLPSRGFSEPRARAICRRLVAVHCLYGCDRNKLAVELAKLSLWLESYAEGLPLTFLDHRLVHGDALTGPFFAIAFNVAGDRGRRSIRCWRVKCRGPAGHAACSRRGGWSRT